MPNYLFFSLWFLRLNIPISSRFISSYIFPVWTDAESPTDASLQLRWFPSPTDNACRTGPNFWGALRGISKVQSEIPSCWDVSDTFASWKVLFTGHSHHFFGYCCWSNLWILLVQIHCNIAGLVVASGKQ